MNKKQLLATIVPALYCASPLAQSATTNSPTEIIITAKGRQTLADVATTAHVLDSKAIENAQSPDLPTLLNQISGVSQSNSGGRGSASSLFVRGAASRQIVVLVDGIRVGSATLGSTELGHIPLEFIDRIEVVKGPLSGLYGADAVGGVIQIFTKQGTAQGSELSLGVGSNGLFEGSLSTTIGNADNNFRIGITREELDGIDRTDITTDGNEDEDGFEESAVMLAGNFKVSESTSARINALYADNEVEFDNTIGADTGYISENTIESITFALDSAINQNLNWNTTLGWTSDQQVTDVFESDVTSDRVSITSQAEVSLNKNDVLVVGVDYNDEDVETNSDFPETQRDNIGAFAQIQQSFGRIGWVGNLRYDDNSAYGDQTNGSAALNVKLSEKTRVTVSYGTAFRAPTFNELYFPGFGNPDVQPEESETVELSLRGNHNQTDWRISLFDQDIDNLIDFDLATFTANNIASASLQGIEFELSTLLAGWQLSSNINFLSAEDNDTGIELDGRPKQTLNLVASKQFGKLGTRIALYAEKGRFDLEGTELPSFGKLDIGGSYQLSNAFKVLASVNNVFDKDYTLNLVNSSNRYNTEGRTVSLTAKYSF